MLNPVHNPKSDSGHLQSCYNQVYLSLVFLQLFLDQNNPNNTCMRSIIIQPGHGLSGEELQLVVIQTETTESEQTSKRLGGQVVQRVVAQTKPLDVVQALEDESHHCRVNTSKYNDKRAEQRQRSHFSTEYFYF